MTRIKIGFHLAFKSSVIARSLSVLNKSDQKKIVAVVFIQVAMALLDLLGVAVIGVLGALAVNGVQSRQPGNRVNQVLEILGIENLTFQSQAAILGIAATLILVSRTLFSIFFTRKTLFFLSRRGAVISSTLISRLLSQSLLYVQSRTVQQTLFAISDGVRVITLGVLAASVSLIADIAILTVMAVGLFIVDPTIALGTFLVFAMIGLALYKLMHNKARNLGISESALTIKSAENIVEVLGSYREAIVRNRRDYYAREIGLIRLELADTLAELSFLPNVSKYIIETTVVLGALLISGLQFFLQDASHAVATLAVFLAAGTRVAPAIMRVQQSALTIRSSLGTASPTLDLIDELGGESRNFEVEDNVQTIHSDFQPTLSFENVSFSYPSATEPAVSNVSLEIPSGKSIAFVGGSGAGKTTIVDLLLGILSPNSGSIQISGKSPLLAVARWPGAVSYVPQDVMISNGSVLQNVAMGFSLDFVDEDLVWEALEIAQLKDFVLGLPNGLNTQVGERGAKLSGGQRQRLGIARAMFTNPKLLVLDEATSALDGQTEFDISSAINRLKGRVTVVMIAHRLSTVRHADIIFYLEKGRIISTGSFEEVRNAVPDFDRQAGLMGL